MKKNDFLKNFISNEWYLQNPPLKAKKFIEFCKKRGINTSLKELEFFEKERLLFPIIRIDRPIYIEERVKFINESDGVEYWRPARNGLRAGEKELEHYKEKYYSYYDFSEHNKPLLEDWFNNGLLFNPSTKKFQNWDSFTGERLENGSEKIDTFYSSFQIYWLEVLKKSFSISINLAGNEINVSTELNQATSHSRTGSFSITNIDEFLGRLKNVSKKEVFDKFFDFEKKKEVLRQELTTFNNFLQFLLCVQNAYYPYAKSGARKIQISVEDKKWQEIIRSFDLKKELGKLNYKIEDIANWYRILSKKAMNILGIKRDDWVQLWKSFSWNKKDKLEGNIRLGVEYLQWTIMIKRVIEECLQNDILDIDEIDNITSEDILKFDPLKMNQNGDSLRTIRNKRYSDEERNYYKDKYKRLYYLSNSFGLDYQPRIIVFVEGATEEKVFPKVFEWYVGQSLANWGIEVINFKGVDSLLSTAKNSEKLRNLLQQLQKESKQQILSKNKNTELNQVIKNLQNVDIVISNWTSFLSYNLEKWQIIPFFISDNEGNIEHFLKAEKPIRFNKKNYNVPDKWKFLWGTSNDNKPFKGKDFEMANFNNKEIATVLAEVLNKQITENEINEIRDKEQGIRQIDKNAVEQKKVKIAEKLFDNLLAKFKKDKKQDIFERPIFKVIEKVAQLASLNHLPVDTRIELENKEIIEKWLTEG